MDFITRLSMDALEERMNVLGLWVSLKYERYIIAVVKRLSKCLAVLRHPFRRLSTQSYAMDHSLFLPPKHSTH